MQKRNLKILGLILIILGITILINSYTAITRLTILNETAKTTISILGIIFVIGGILLLMARDGEGGLEKISEAHVSLEPTDRFIKAIKKHDIKKINEALRKIGTGKGNEHRLSTGDYTISTSKGGRIVFDYDDSRSNAVLEDYDEGHDYKKMLGR